MKTLLLFLLVAPAALCQQKELDELMTAYNKVNKFNGTVLVSQKGKVLLRKGYGLKTTNTPNDANSIFQIYSITKSFTSTLVMKLVEMGKLSLDDSLSKFYPGFPKGDSITIRHLLSHTAGIFEYTKGYDGPDMNEASFIAFLKKKPLDFSPGTQWSYSNSGYWLLGFIIAKVSSMPYEEAVKKYIFKPLHMNNSGFDFKRLSDKNKTVGFANFSEHKKKEAIIYEAPGPFAAGAIYSTVDDLYKFHQALNRHSIISDASLKTACTPVKNNYGLGWMINTFEGHPLIAHSGGAAGFRSNFARLPDEDICIVVLNNTEQANVDMITKDLLRVLLHKPYKIPFEIPLPAQVLDRYAGAFAFESFTVYITVEDGKLAGQPSQRPKTVMLAEKENEFRILEANASLEFIKDSTGNYNQAILKGDQQMTGKRIYPTWGLIGDAIDKGWGDKQPDIPFTETARGIWVLKNVTLKDGQVIFRLNNDWGYHYGATGNKLEMFGPNISVKAGTYTITLDLRKPDEPALSIQKF